MGAANYWDVIWSRDRLYTSVIHSMGAEVMLKMDRETFGLFFRSFFSLPTDMWIGFLDRTHTTRDVVIAFARMFLRAPLRIKFLLGRSGASAALRRPLISAVFGGLFLKPVGSCDVLRKPLYYRLRARLLSMLWYGKDAYKPHGHDDH